MRCSRDQSLGSVWHPSWPATHPIPCHPQHTLSTPTHLCLAQQPAGVGGEVPPAWRRVEVGGRQDGQQQLVEQQGLQLGGVPEELQPKGVRGTVRAHVRGHRGSTSPAAPIRFCSGASLPTRLPIILSRQITTPTHR